MKMNNFSLSAGMIVRG